MSRTATRLSATGGRLLPGLLFCVLVLAVYADPVFLRRNFAGRDLSVYNLPMEKAVHDAYARGRLPVWMPEISGGRPLLPNPNAGAFYPIRPLLSVVPFPLAMRLFPVLHWIAAGLGMIALARSLGVSRAGSWLGAVTYVFSGVGVSEVFFPHIHPGMALLPWIVWAVRRPFSSTTGKVLVLSLLYGLIFSSGDVFTIGMALGASLLWIAIETPKPERPREFLLLAAALALAGFLAAPPILATALWIPETNRAVLGMKLKESLFFSIHPLRLVELIVPFPYGAVWRLLDHGSIWGWRVFHYKAMGVFTTLYAGAFAVIALAATRKERSPGFRFGRTLFLLSLICSVLPALIPASLVELRSLVPLRNPEKFAVAMVFALALTAALSVDRLRADPRRLRWPLVVSGVLTAAALLATLHPGAAGRIAVELIRDRRFERAAAAELPRALTEGALLWTVTVVAVEAIGRRSRAALALALVLLTAVPILANRKIARSQTELAVFAPSRFARLLQRMDPRNAYRAFGELTYQQALWNRGMVFNRDFDVGDLSRLQSLRRLAGTAAQFNDSQTFFASLSLRWCTRSRDQKPLAGYHRFGGDVLMDWDVLEEAEPDIRLARNWVEESSGVDAVAALPSLKAGEIVLETGRQGRGNARPGIVRVLTKEPELLEIETVTQDPTWLFVLRGFWNHRTVLLDGRPVDYVPAQLAFSAVPVPAGRHRIEWRERVPGGKVSRWGPVLWGLGAAALVARSRRRVEAPR